MKRLLVCSLALAALAVPGLGQTVTTDCRETLGGIRCQSTNNQIQIPDFVGNNQRREQDRLEGLRRAMETRALIEQMKSQMQLNRALTQSLSRPVVAAPAPVQPSPAPVQASPAAPTVVMDLPEILDYAKALLVRHKAGELSAEMLKGLVKARMNAWHRSLPAQGLTPIEIDKLVVLAMKELAPIKNELKP